jgi:hypothetical protein
LTSRGLLADIAADLVSSSSIAPDIPQEEPAVHLIAVQLVMAFAS